jgi:hypothetical protein
LGSVALKRELAQPVASNAKVRAGMKVLSLMELSGVFLGETAFVQKNGQVAQCIMA